MQPPHPLTQTAEFRALQDSLGKARNTRITKVVAAIDAMEARGAADEVIAPLRPRLGELQLARPLRWSRLLFMPLDPLIVPGKSWRPGDPLIPRTCLACLASAVQIGMGADAEVLLASIENRTTADAHLLKHVGRVLWPAAARILAGEDLPEGWAETGLRSEAFAPLARNIAAALEQVLPMDVVCAEAELGVEVQFGSLHPILLAAAERGETALTMVIVLLLTRLPQTGSLLDHGTLKGPASGNVSLSTCLAAARAMMFARIEASGGVEALVGCGSLEAAAAEVRHIDALLRGLRSTGSAAEAAQREAAIRHRLDASCRTRFTSGLAKEFVEKLDDLAPSPDAATLAGLEETARNLRALESEARRVGSAELYDRLLQETAATVTCLDLEGMAGLVDKVRLVEILVGPDEALVVLAGGLGEPDPPTEAATY